MLGRLLGFGFAYDFMQWALGDHEIRSYFVEHYLDLKPGAKVLDVGCGPGSMLPYVYRVGSVEYVGVDSNPRYIERAAKRFAGMGTFRHASATDAKAYGSGYDAAIGFGILHHLNDDEAHSLFTLTLNALKPEGRFATVDATYVDNQNWIAYWMYHFDRGKYVRRRQGYAALARRVFPKVQVFDFCGRVRLPLDHAVLVCEKSGSQGH